MSSSDSFPSPNVLLQPREVLLANYQNTGDPVVDSSFAQGSALRAAGRFGEAAKVYESLLHSHLDLGAVRLNLGVCYLKLGQVQRARRLYLEAPTDSCDLQFNYAATCLLVGKRFQAKEALLKCLETAQGALKADASWVLRKLEATRPKKEEYVDDSQDVFDCVMVEKTRRKTYGPAHKQHKSLSVQSATKTGFKQSKSSRWTVFKPVEQYAHSPPLNFKPVFHPTKRASSISARPTSAAYRVPTGLKAPNSEDHSKSSLFQHQRSSVSVTIEPKVSKTIKVRRRGSLVEEDLEDELALKNAKIDLEAVTELHETVTRVGKSLDIDSEKLLSLPAAEIPAGKKMSIKEVAWIREEMRKEALDRDYHKLVLLVSKLHYFAKFKPEVQEELLRLGGHTHITEGDYVFKQGDSGSNVYAIFKGSIVVRRHGLEYGTEPLIVRTLYDGDSFGELSLFTVSHFREPPGRSASCQAVEDTDLFYLSKAEFHRIMMREVEIRLHSKLGLLLKLPIFIDVRQFDLVPLAATLTPVQYKIGQYLAHVGDIPAGLHLIVAGRCNIYSEGFSLREKTALKPGPSRKASPRATSWSFSQGRKQGESFYHIIPKEILETDSKLKSEIKAFFNVESTIPLMDKYNVTRERRIQGVLSESSFFAGRTLLSTPDKVTPCKFSIVADSAEVQIYIISHAQMSLLNEKLVSQVYYILSRWSDPDCPPHLPLHKIQAQFTQWNNYKDKLVTQALKRQHC